MKLSLSRLAVILILLGPVSARADEDTLDMSRAVFVLMADQAAVTVIDPDTDRIAGRIDTGLVPRQIELAPSINKLLAIDGTNPRINVVDLVTGTMRSVDPGLVPSRLTVSPSGLTAALADTEAGHVVLLDLLRGRITGDAGHLPKLRDMVFSADSTRLYLAGEHAGAIDVITVSTGLAGAPLATGVPGGSRALSRAPNGRRLFVQPDPGEPIGVIDLEQSVALAPVPVGLAPTPAFPSAMGAYLLAGDNRAGTLTILHDRDARSPVVLKASTGIGRIYTAWFDTLALVPDASTRTLLLYDLEAMRPAGSIALAAEAARGAVTPDGQKLYLPLPEAGQVAVINARDRRLAASVSVPGQPAAVVLAGSYGVCH
jgi:hypothetical protein